MTFVNAVRGDEVYDELVVFYHSEFLAGQIFNSRRLTSQSRYLLIQAVIFLLQRCVFRGKLLVLLMEAPQME